MKINNFTTMPLYTHYQQFLGIKEDWKENSKICEDFCDELILSKNKKEEFNPNFIQKIINKFTNVKNISIKVNDVKEIPEYEEVLKQYEEDFDFSDGENASQMVSAFALPIKKGESEIFLNFEKSPDEIIIDSIHELMHPLQYADDEFWELVSKTGTLDNNPYNKASQEIEHYNQLTHMIYSDNNLAIPTKDLYAHPLDANIYYAEKKPFDDLNEYINYLIEKHNIEDKQLALKYFTFHMLQEAQAYRAQTMAGRKLGLEIDGNFDPPKTYEDLYKVLKNMTSKK